MLLFLVIVLVVTTGEAVTAPAASADPAPAAKDPRELPLVPSAPQRADAVAGADPGADFGPVAKLAGSGGSRFDPRRSKLVSRDMFTEEYLNPDGTRTLRQSSDPLNVQDGAGNWRPVDTGLRADPATGRAKVEAHPLNASLAGRADDPELVKVEVAGKSATLAMDRVSARASKVAGNTTEYRDVRPNLDLAYEVTPGEVKETIVVKAPPAPGAASWRFTLKTDGLTPSLVDDGSVRLADESGDAKVVMPPIETWDSAGDANSPPAMTGGRYGLRKVGAHWELAVSVDEGWLRDAKRVYPVRVDPTFSFGVVNSHAYRSDGYSCTGCGLRVGNSQNNGDSYNRSVFNVDYKPLFGKTVVGARMDVRRNTSVVGSVKTWNADLHHASAFNFNGVGGHMASALVGDVGSFSGDGLTGFLRTAVDKRDATAYFMLRGSEVPGTWTYKNLHATLYVDTGSAPPATSLVAPADHSVITDLTPTLSVRPVSDPDGDPVRYCFTVATGPDAKSGVVVDSGCLATPTWKIPPGVLQDGVAYTWRAVTYSGITTTAPSWVGRFKVDQRIGERGPAPVDEAGPVSVNLANGNLTTSADSPTFHTVGGNAGLSMTYNSQQQDAKGLRASYFVDLSRNGLINPQQQPVLVRTEPQVNVDWGAASPFAPALGADWFVTRWEGFFQAPVAGTYQFAGVHDDGAVVWVNNAKVYDVGKPSDVNWTESTNVTLAAGQRVPIKVEHAEATGAAKMRLFVRTADNTTVPPQVVPADWLYTSELPALPRGWTLSADLDGTGASYTSAQVTDQTVVLTDATGAKHTWTKKSTGGYTPPEGEDGILAMDTGGRVTLHEGPDVYTFRPDGKLESQSSVQDSRKPATLSNVYDGFPSRLREIKDPVSGRSHRLHYNRAGDDCYGGVTPPLQADALPPAQMLCRITYWDGTETRLWYYQGRLARIEDPGSEITDYGYDATGLLTLQRSPLVNDWVAVDVPGRNGNQDVLTAITYDAASGKPKATKVTEPAPALGAPRPETSYRYDPANRQTFTDVAGLHPATGFAGKVTYDEAERELSTTDATGKTSTKVWSVKDQVLRTTDPAGRVSTTIYDAQDRPVDSYGPAPGSCFTAQHTPALACAGTVPHKRTNYDEGINGLTAAFYANPGLTGAPKAHTTGIGPADGRIQSPWEYSNDITPGVTADAFSVRLTGEIVFPAAGDYQLRAYVDDGIRMWIDDQLVMDFWQVSNPAWRQATVRSGAAGQARKIRIDYYDNGGYAKLDLHWTTPGGVQQLVPGAQLKARYGLETSTVSHESDGVPDQHGGTRYADGLDPTYGLATASVSDQGGLGLTTHTGYEPPGSGYLRKTSQTMPTGARTSYAYYGDTEARINPCVPGSPAINQGGMAKLTTSTAPASGPARVDEQVYDASGRVVAKATSGDWSCTTYDARDRTIRQTVPGNATAPARTVTTDYAVGGDPLTTAVTDQFGTITTTVDFLGRTVAYTDVHGTRTETRYDQAGRAVEEKVTPPNPADPPQTSTMTYDDAGRLLTTDLGQTRLATVTYDQSGELATATYANGSSLAAVGKDPAGQTTSLTWKTSDGKEIVSRVARTRAGTITDESLDGVDPRPDGANYRYDALGRLTEAWVAGHHYTYDFTSAAPSTCPAGTQANAGANTNRVRLLDKTAAGTAETGYCYDAADRILATTGPSAVTGITYDTHGNTVQFTSGGSTTHLGWDAADRHLTARTTGADPADVGYVRDATDRIVRRGVTQGDSVSEVLYAFTGDGDTADLVLAGDKRLLSRSISLPGGALYTVRGGDGAAAPRWDHPTVRGDLALATDPAGKQVGGVRTYTPYGEPLTAAGVVDPDNVPDNQPGQFDYGWLGQHQRPYEHAGALAIVQMGARPYLPALGRFLSVDPVPGGSANDYEYVSGDPVNTVDIDGRAIWIPLIGACVRWCGKLFKAGRALVSRIRAANRSGKAAVGRKLAKRYGKNRVVLQNSRGRLKVDLAGKAHGGVRTPHTVWQARNSRSPHGWGKTSRRAYPASWFTIGRAAWRIFRRR